MDFSYLSLLLAVLSFLFFDAQSASCTDAYECQEETVSDENVYCYGYFSCYESNVISEENVYMYGDGAGYKATINSSYDGYCYGGLGCYGAEMNIYNDHRCEGYGSCAYSNMNTGDDFYARGVYALLGSTLDGDDYLYTYGYFTGAYSVISNFNRIYNYGFLSLYYATITTPGQGDNYYMYNYGYYSSYGATLTCQGGDTCYIYCDSTGCDELTIYVDSESSYSYSCSDTCATCPTVEEEEDSETGMRKLLFTSNKNGKNNKNDKVPQREGAFSKDLAKEYLFKDRFGKKGKDRKDNYKQFANKILKHHNLESVDQHNDDSFGDRDNVHNNDKTFAFTLINDFDENDNNNNGGNNLLNKNNLLSFGASMVGTMTVGLIVVYGINKQQQK